MTMKKWKKIKEKDFKTNNETDGKDLKESTR